MSPISSLSRRWLAALLGVAFLPVGVFQATAQTAINVDFGANTYTGTAVAPDTGTTWNKITSQSSNSVTLPNVVRSNGSATTSSITVATTAGTISAFSAASPGNPNPLNLMNDYIYGGNFTVTVNNLAAGNYLLYVFAHGDNANQNNTVALALANGGGSGTTASTGTEYRNLFAAGAEGSSYLKFTASVGVAGALAFTATNGAGGYLNGFQLMPFPLASITIQPPPSPSASIGGDFSMSVSATGEGTLTYQWRKGGVPLANGATGNGSTISGATTDTLTISTAQEADAGDYDVVVTNPGGSVPSTTAALTVSSTPLPPSIATQPVNKTVLSGVAVSFNVVANGTSPLAYQWYKGSTPLINGVTAQGSTIAGANSAQLTITNTKIADAGSYSVEVTNAPATSGTATSTPVILTVNQAPTITSQPTGAIVASGSNYLLSAGLDPGSPVATYQWKRSTDGMTYTNVVGGTGATLNVTGGPTTSGFYTVTATNSNGTVTSSVVYVGIPSIQSPTFAPANNATGIAIDQQLRIVFPSAPKLGVAGVLRIHDAANGAVVTTIDRSLFQTYLVDSTTIVNARTNTQQGDGYYYMPIAIFGNEVWITLSTSQRLSYGKTYYVTMDAGLLLDSTNAAVPAITDPLVWRFSTKASGPATPTVSTGPTTITVGMDGSGDFATIQGAADWVPQNNTLPRTITVASGTYHESINIAQNRRFLTIAGDRNDRKAVEVYHPSPATSDSRSAGIIRIACDDVTVRDLTLDTGVYLAQPNPAGSFGPAIVAFPGRINTLLTTGKRLVFDNLLILAGQDTVYAVTGIAYFNKCEIWGSVDFIYGDALAVFDQCNIVEVRNTGGPINAPSTPLAQPHGLVFLNCTFPQALTTNGYPYNVGSGTTTFCRPWRQDGAVAIINCQLGAQFSTKAWSEWDGRENTSRAREYGNTLIGGGVAPSPALRQAAGAYWLNTIDPDYVSNTSLTGSEPSLALPNGPANRNAVTVNPADYTLTAIFGHSYFNLSGWMPSLVSRIVTQPASQVVNPGQNVTFTTAATGTPVPTYQWYKNGSPIPGATGASYNIPSASGSDWGSYIVIATNSAGSATSNVATLTFSDPLANYVASYGLDPATTGAPTEDPEGDGVNNKLEFFLGGNPAKADLPANVIMAKPTTSGPAGLVFEFNRSKAASSVAYTVEYSFSLTGAWSVATHGLNGVTIVTQPLNSNFDHITVTIPSAEPKAFARLKL